MQYRRRPTIFNRKYINSGFNGFPSADRDSEALNSSVHESELKRFEEIPLPNEVEAASEAAHGLHRGAKLPLLDIFKNRIHIDDLILIGLIFLILDEGLDDDFFLIILLYILLF